MTISSGSRLGPYEIISLLGEGGMGEVYRARDSRLGREVAIKVLPSSFSADPDRLLRFEREARAASALNHPNILTIHDIGTQDGAPYIVSELLEGATLRAKLGSPLSQRKAIDFALQIASGLGAAHAKGIVHRDLKPENLFVTSDNRVKILDFGLAKLTEREGWGGLAVDAPTVPALTEPGAIVGTVGYMSPEQVRGLAVDPRSDVFSFGAILYEMLSGRKAFRKDSPVDTLSAILNEEPPELTESHANVSPSLERIVRHCLEKDRDNRFQTAKDIAFALSETSEFAQIAGRNSKPSRAISKAAAAAVGAALVLLVAGVVIPHLTRRPLPQATEASIAVLPFQNLSADKDQEYFSDGLSEELMGLLVKVKQLRVAGRTSSFSFRGKSDDLASIGQKLHVATVLEGSVRRSGERLRVSTRLVNVADGYQIWAETYERKMADIFAMQDEIARAVVAALRLKLLPQERPPSSEQRTSNPEAYNQYLLGRHLITRGNAERLRRAVEALGNATSLDTNFAPAYAYLAIAEFSLSEQADTAEALSQGRREAFAAADRAIALDPKMAEGYSARGYLRCWVSWDWAGSKADFVRALSLEPGNPVARGRYATLLASAGRLPEAIAELERATEIDPLSPLAWNRLATYLYSSGRLADARRALRIPLEMEPEGSFAQFHLGMISLLEHEPQVALAEFSREQADAAYRLTGIAVAENDLGHAAQSQIALDELISKYSFGAAFQVAGVYAWRRAPDKAFEWLDRACEEHDTGIAELEFDPLIARVRDDPRYAALLKRVNLPDPVRTATR